MARDKKAARAGEQQEQGVVTGPEISVTSEGARADNPKVYVFAGEGEFPAGEVHIVDKGEEAGTSVIAYVNDPENKLEVQNTLLTGPDGVAFSEEAPTETQQDKAPPKRASGGQGRKRAPSNVVQASPEEEAAGEVDADAQTGRGGRSVIDQQRYRYEANGIKTKAGRKSVDNGDPIATAIRGMDADQVVELVRSNGGAELIKPGWATLNPGLRRMTASNVLRGLLSRNKQVQIGDSLIKLPEAQVTQAEGAAPSGEQAAQPEGAAPQEAEQPQAGA